MSLTAKQEKFCQAIVSGMNQSDAYRHAYDASKTKPDVVNVKASQLMANGKVKVRVAELRKPVVAAVQAKAVYGLEQAMAEAAEAMEICRNKEQGGAMVSAVVLRSKLNGLLIERKEVRTGPLDDLPVDQLLAMQQAIDAIRRAREAA